MLCLNHDGKVPKWQSVASYMVARVEACSAFVCSTKLQVSVCSFIFMASIENELWPVALSEVVWTIQTPHSQLKTNSYRMIF